MLNFFKNIWHRETPNVTSAAILIGIASLASRLVGVLRDRLLASTFGAGGSLDAYYAAFRLPDFFYQLIVLGAVSAGFIPVFAEYLEQKGKDEASKLVELVFSLMVTALGAVCIIMAIFADRFVPWTVPGFTGEKLVTTIFLSRVLLISTFILGLSAVMGGVLQATRRFIAFSFAPVLYNLGIILGIVFIAPKIGIVGVAWGVVIGAFLHFFVQSVVALPLAFNKLRLPNLHEPGIRRILRLTAPRIAALASTQVNDVILIALASSLTAGSIAVFNLANNLQFVPIGLIGVSFAVAAFPAFSQFAAAKDTDGLRVAFLSTARKIFFLILPSMAIMLLLRAQIIRLLFGAGEFDWSATIRTADALAMFVLSLGAQSVSPLIARAFYALQDSKTPFFVAVLTVIINLSLALWLKGPFGVAGLAAAFTVGAYVQFGLLWFLLRRRLGSLDGKELFISLGKTALASLALFGFGWLARQYVGTIFPLRTFWQVALQAGAALTLGIAAFSALAVLLKVKEYSEFLSAMKSKLLRKAKITEGADQARGL